jgi:hypothetical protein
MLNPTLLTMPFKLNKTSTNGITCQLHHTYTRLLLTFCFVVSTYRQLTGNAILCDCPDFKVENFCNFLCLTNGTYTVPNKSLFAISIDADREYHFYYQFVPITFLLQMISFGLPNMFWEYTLNSRPFLFYYKFLLIKSVFLAHLIASYVSFRELLGTQRFVQGNFPLYSRCDIAYMANSDVNKYSVFCLLPLNILYSKMFPVIHAWFLFLFVATTINLAFRSLLLISSVRMYLYGNESLDVHQWSFKQQIELELNQKN